jgi:hypothetical protein
MALFLNFNYLGGARRVFSFLSDVSGFVLSLFCFSNRPSPMPLRAIQCSALMGKKLMLEFCAFPPKSFPLKLKHKYRDFVGLLLFLSVNESFYGFHRQIET